jgi:diacylglycerol kinase family enzyme
MSPVDNAMGYPGIVGTNLNDGRIIPVDVGDVNGHLFLNNSSFGIYPHLVQEREAHQQKGRSKWLALCLAAIRALNRYPRVRGRIRVDRQALVRTSPMVS